MPALQAFDVVIEASGSSQGIMLAAAICRPMGTIVLKSSEHARERLQLMSLWHSLLRRQHDCCSLQLPLP